jgi:Domain of unknown function (DUF4436)
MDQPRSRTRRLLALGAVLIALTAGYAVTVRQFDVTEVPLERHFGATDKVVPAGEVYIEPLSIDALNDAMQVRAYLEPGITESKSAKDTSEHDLTLLVSHDNTVEEIKLATGDHIASSTFEVDLNEGSVSHYPFDDYVVRLGIEVRDSNFARRLPARVTVWEGALGYNLQTTGQPGPDSDDIQLTTKVKRSGAFALFALCAYGAMLVLAFCALAIGVLTFAGMCRPEATLIGALAAIAFALPVLRNTMPGSPPLGVSADVWVFLWTELAVVFALALMVFKWARSGLSD